MTLLSPLGVAAPSPGIGEGQMKSVFLIAGGVALAAANIAYANEDLDKLEVFRSLALTEGNWHSVITIEDASLVEHAESDLVIEQLREQTASMIGRTYENDDCIGNSLAANGDLVLPGLQVQSLCTVTHSEVGDGQFDLAFACGPQGNLSAQYSGTIERDAIDATLQTVMKSPKVTTHITMKISGKKAGSCQKM